MPMRSSEWNISRAWALVRVMASQTAVIIVAEARDEAKAAASFMHADVGRGGGLCGPGHGLGGSVVLHFPVLEVGEDRADHGGADQQGQGGTVITREELYDGIAVE